MKKVIAWMKKECHETAVLLKCIPASLMTFFVLSIVLMNLLANKSIDLQVSWLALDAGITVSWLAFLTMDILKLRHILVTTYIILLKCGEILDYIMHKVIKCMIHHLQR